MRTDATSHRADGRTPRALCPPRIGIRGGGAGLTLVAAFAGCTPAFGPALRAALERDIGEVLQENAYASGVDFGAWPRLVDKHRAEIVAATNDDELTNAYDAALGDFGVSHLALLSPREAAERAAGTRAGAGVTVQSIESGLLLTDVVVDGPASRAGMKRGDVLQRIDGRPVRSAADLPAIPGQEREFEWRRDGATRVGTVRYAAHRRTSPDELTWIDGGVALVSIHSFSDGLYDRPTVERIFREARDAAGVVLDVRSNKGGNADNVRHLLGLLLPADTPLFGDVYREQADEYSSRSGETAPHSSAVARALDRNYLPIVSAEPPLAGRLAVLIDGQCGSGGELAPAILQETARARLIGTRTRGRVRIGENFELTGGFELQTPIGELVTAGGRMLEDVGIAPDVELSPEATANDATILAAALDSLCAP